VAGHQQGVLISREAGRRERELTSDTPATAPAANWYIKGKGFASFDDMMAGVARSLENATDGKPYSYQTY
jgi:hypothetical protein